MPVEYRGEEHFTKAEVEAIVKARVRKLQEERLTIIPRLTNAEATAAAVPGLRTRAEAAEARVLRCFAAMRHGVTDPDTFALLEQAWTATADAPAFGAWLADAHANPDRAPAWLRPVLLPLRPAA